MAKLTFHWHQEQEGADRPSVALRTDTAVGLDYVAEQVVTAWGTVSVDHVAIVDMATLTLVFSPPRCPSCRWLKPACQCDGELAR